VCAKVDQTHKIALREGEGRRRGEISVPQKNWSIKGKERRKD